MGSTSNFLITIGGLMFVGLVADSIGRSRIGIPRVTVLILMGVLVGPPGFNLLPENSETWFPFLATIALTMIGFLVGGQLSAKELKTHGLEVIEITAVQFMVTTLFVTGGCLFLGYSLELSLVLGGIAGATAPAATADVIQGTGSNNRFSRNLIGVVALDDVLGIVVFSIILMVIGTPQGVTGTLPVFVTAGRELVGAILLGVVLGIPGALLTGRLQDGEPILEEALALVFFCAGLAHWLEVSLLLSAVVLGGLITNIAVHHDRPFHEIENIEQPFLVLFFVLAGASLEVDKLPLVGSLGFTYVGLRSVGKLTGGVLGGRICGWPLKSSTWFGLALLPQAGVALGMALILGEQYPALGEVVIPVIVGSCVIFELFGPILTKQALIHNR